MRITDDLLSGIALIGVHVRELRFLDNLEQSGRAKRPPSDLTIEIETAISEDEKAGRVLVKASLRPSDESATFKEASAVVEGHFKVGESSSAVSMKEFLSRQGPIILMPFVRDAIADATQKSRFGPILIQPINVAAMLDRLEKQDPPRDSAQEPPA